MTKPRKVRCPQCGGDALWAPGNPWRPFCSERCKTGDLGAWASNAYVVSGESREDLASDADVRQDAHRD